MLEGCWKDFEGWVYRHAQSPHGHAFEKWTGADWAPTPHPGTWGWSPCADPSVPEYRDAYRSKEWALENRDKLLVTEEGEAWRFSSKILTYEYRNTLGAWVIFGSYSHARSRPEKGTW